MDSLVGLKIFKGIVTSNTDSTESGVVSVSINNSKTLIKAVYTSPYFARYTTGIFAPPATGSHILVAYSEDEDKYYYISTIVEHPAIIGAAVKYTTGGISPVINDALSYSPSGTPSIMTFKDDTGAGLKITNYRTQNKPIANQTVLKSTQGHKLILSDSPDKDCAILKNKDGDGITITANKNKVHSSNSIVIHSRNSHRCTVLNGDYIVRVVDGRDLTLINESTGFNKKYYDPEAALNANLASNPLEQYGNINLVSRTNDINIYTGGDTPAVAATTAQLGGDVLISTLSTGSVIQINSNGDVKIFANVGKVSVQAFSGISLVSESGDIDIQAPSGNINMLGNNINVAALTNLNAQGGAATNLGMGGIPLNLNNVGSPPASVEVLGPEIPKLNAYGR